MNDSDWVHANVTKNPAANASPSPCPGTRPYECGVIPLLARDPQVPVLCSKTDPSLGGFASPPWPGRSAHRFHQGVLADPVALAPEHDRTRRRSRLARTDMLSTMHHRLTDTACTLGVRPQTAYELPDPSGHGPDSSRDPSGPPAAAPTSLERTCLCSRRRVCEYAAEHPRVREHAPNVTYTPRTQQF